MRQGMGFEAVAATSAAEWHKADIAKQYVLLPHAEPDPLLTHGLRVARSSPPPAYDKNASPCPLPPRQTSLERDLTSLPLLAGYSSDCQPFSYARGVQDGPESPTESNVAGATGARSRAPQQADASSGALEPLSPSLSRPLARSDEPLVRQVACGVFFIHVVAWIAIFVRVFAGFDKPSQDNCSDELPLRRYKIILSTATAAFLFLALIFWAAFAGGLTRHLRKRNSYRKDTLV